MNKMFDIDKFNVISDEENYYFFRALNNADNNDIETGIILNNENNYTRIRTDRERFEETSDRSPKYSETSEMSLEEVFDHIKMHYRKDTNCISLSSNANVSRIYGAGYNDKYVMVKVPKSEMGKRVINAGQYILEEVEKRIEQAIGDIDLSEDVKQKLEQIDEAKTSEEIKGIIETRYVSKKPINTSKAKLRKEIVYKAPHSRVSNYQALNEEQTLEKNKIIAKLTVLEEKRIMEPLIPRTANNRFLIQTIGSAFSSSEQIYYGDIEGDKITNVSKEVVGMFALLQQAEEKDKEAVEEIKAELIKFVNEGNTIELSEERDLSKTDELRKDITIDEMYQLTNGRVEYGQANSIVKNMYYLAKGQSTARNLTRELRKITNNNPKYQEVMEYLENNGFEVQAEISTRRSNRGYKLSESVNLDLKPNEFSLIEEIRGLTDEEQIDILQKGGLSNIKDIMTSNFAKVSSQEQIEKDEYYAGAIIDSYTWSEIGIEEFSITQKNKLVEKLREKKSVDIYNKLKEAGIPEADIPVSVINIASKENFEELINSDNYINLIQDNKEQLTQKPSIEQIETFLGYYDLEGTDIKLRDYQRSAVDRVEQIFETKKFSSVLLPTGAGKSFVAVTELLEHKDEPMLYLAPSDEILEQMKDYIIKYVHGEKGTLGKTKEEIVAEVFPNIKFETYTGLLAKRGKEVINEQYKFIVLDELHRTGAKEWEKQLDELLENQDEEVKVLGITATPTRDVDDRNMANEMALKLGYTEEEIQERVHIAMDMDVIDAIKLGILVNPKVVSCVYNLKNNGDMENLMEKINSITDENEKQEKLKQYEELRRNVEKAEGVPQILQSNIKPGGKYIVFIPVTDQEAIEDEDGNIIGTRTGEERVKEYEKYIQECFQNSGINPACYSMLGAYGKKKNQEQLELFESDKSEETKFMIVMNKANEGLHIEGINGIIWFRALDENSKILYLQQLGRALRPEDPNNPTKDEDRPVVIDLANNTARVNIDKDMKTNNRREDLELLTIVVDWVKTHDVLPDIESSSAQERRYAATLYRIQNKYMQYIEGLEEADKFDNIEKILNKGAEIDLWNIELPPKSMQEINKIINIDAFEVRGILKDYVELKGDLEKTLGEQIIEFIERNGRMLGSVSKKKVAEMTEDEKSEARLYGRWKKSQEREIYKLYKEKPIKEVPEEHRELISKIREAEKLREELEKIKLLRDMNDFIEENGRIPRAMVEKSAKELTEDERSEKKLYHRWYISEARQIYMSHEEKPIEEVPEEYRELISKIRETKKSIMEQVLDFMEKNGRMPRGLSEKRINEMTEDEKSEARLYSGWKRSKEKKQYEEYKGKPIEEVPEEYKRIVQKAKDLGECKCKELLEEIEEYIEQYGHLPMSISNKDKTEEGRKGESLYQKWCRSEERKICQKYNGNSLEEIPEEDREVVRKAKELGMYEDKEEKDLLEEIEEYKEQYGHLPKSSKKKAKDRDEEERIGHSLYRKWCESSEEKKICEKYNGMPLEEIPEEDREVVRKAKDIGMYKDKEEKDLLQEIEEYIEQYGHLPISISNKDKTEESIIGDRLYQRWINSEERKICQKHNGRPLGEIPEEDRETVKKAKDIGMYQDEKELLEEIEEYIEQYGHLPKASQKKAQDMTEEGRIGYNLYQRWGRSEERQLCEKYNGKLLEEIPEEDRETVRRAKDIGIYKEEKELLEEIEEYIEQYGHLPKTSRKNVKDITEEEKIGRSLYAKWGRSEEKKICEKYSGMPLEEIPEEDRETVRKAKELGMYQDKSPLQEREDELSKLEREEKLIAEAEALIDRQNGKKLE